MISEIVEVARKFITPSIISIIIMTLGWMYLFEKIIFPYCEKRKYTVVYKVDISLKYAYETNDEFIERAFRERLGSYKIVGYHG